MFLIASVLFGLWLAKPTTAQAPQPNSQDYESGPLVIKQDAIIRPTDTPNPQLPKTVPIPISGRHSTRAEKHIPVDRLQVWLSDKGSPLAPYASQILSSPYYSTIIGICAIEQYGCTKAPGNNYWGIGPGRRFATLEEGIEAISSLLAKYEAKGKDTIEELNGYYVQPASNNWLNTVSKTKQLIENL